MWATRLRENATAALTGTLSSKGFQGPLASFFGLEVAVASVCFFTPLILIGADSWNVRDSISAYFSMQENQWFYFLLTIAAMLFIVNGVIKHNQAYNTLLGIALSGVILFNHDDFTEVHFVFALAFFGGNVLVVLSTLQRAPVKRLLIAGGIAIPLILNFAADWISLFWAEWASFTVITIHYVLAAAYTAGVRLFGQLIKYMP